MSRQERRQERILVVSPKPDKLLAWLTEWTQQYRTPLCSASSGIEGLTMLGNVRPTLILVDAELPDMSGLSFSTIVKDGEDAAQIIVYLYNITRILQNTKADYFMIRMADEEFKTALRVQLNQYFNMKYLETLHSSEIVRAREQQFQQLPWPLHTERFHVTSVFSPMSELSGDGFDYWTGEDRAGLYGLLFDCTGHDIVSFSQSGAIRTLLKKDVKLYQMQVDGYKTLSEVMRDVNADTFAIDADPEPVSAIVFHIDFGGNVMRYCSAGIPALLYKRRGEEAYQIVHTPNYLIGYEDGVEFDEASLDLAEVDEIIISSDGFFELVFHDEEVSDAAIAKHDDVSAIMIRLNRDAGQDLADNNI